MAFATLQIPISAVVSFVEALEVGYSKHKNPYHNLMHAADVTQTVHYLLLKTGMVVRGSPPDTHTLTLTHSPSHTHPHTLTLTHTQSFTPSVRLFMSLHTFSTKASVSVTCTFILLFIYGCVGSSFL